MSRERIKLSALRSVPSVDPDNIPPLHSSRLPMPQRVPTDVALRHIIQAQIGARPNRDNAQLQKRCDTYQPSWVFGPPEAARSGRPKT